MKAVIIAGGSGTRLRPLTYNTPKPMMPLFEKPFLQHQLEWLRRQGITSVIINLHYLSDAIANYFGDGSSLGMEIVYSLEENPMGTAGAVKLAAEHFDGDPMVVINGDILTDVDLKQLLSVHHSKQAQATLMMLRVTDPTSYGLVFTETDGRIIRFLEKPSWDEATVDTVNAGIYVLSPEIFDYVPEREAFSFERGLFPLLLKLDARVYGVTTGAYWIDIGSPGKYLQAHSDILMGRVEVELPATKHGQGVWLAPGVEIDPSAEIRGPAYIGSRSRIRKRASVREFSVIGDDVTVDDRAIIERALVGAKSTIGEDAVIHQCIVGQRCVIGAAAKLGHHLVLADDSVLGRGTHLAASSGL
ncbi:MAG: NDP-sugar synthase [Candidatus Sericytochromatia bacterium]|nr:NDP-sugar synthase [Candidatus Sericytochromatia bacterium]